MLSVVVESSGKVVLKETEIPVPPPGFARVLVKACAICATDLEVIDGNIAAKYPLIPGHEWSGIVESVGNKEDEGWINKRVVGSNDVVCLKCEACRSGQWRYCKSFEEIGFKRNGAYARYVIVPVYGLYQLPDSIPFEIGALCEPLGVAIGILRKAEAKLGDTLLIMGAGSIGLCTLAAAKAMGLQKIVVCASTKKRLKIAKSMGAYEVVATEEQNLNSVMSDIHPDGTDIVIDATGKEECITQGIKLTRKGGCFVLGGYGRGKTMSIRMDDIHINNLRVIGAGNNWNTYKTALYLMENGLVDLSPLISNRIRLEDYAYGFNLARTRPEGFVKAVFIN